MNYEDYFEIEHIDGPNCEVTMDEFIAEAMRTDMKYDATSIPPHTNYNTLYAEIFKMFPCQDSGPNRILRETLSTSPISHNRKVTDVPP